MSKVVIMDHPLIQHKIGYIRRVETGTKDFRQTISEIAMLICYEATRSLPLADVEITTPICDTTVKELKGKKMAIVPILRAGLGMVDGVLNLIPAAKIGHIGLVCHLLKALADMGINTVYLHLRAFGDAYYQSALFPPAKEVGDYDPFSILLEEAHQLHLSVHGWVNPLRLQKDSAMASMSDSYPVKQWYSDPQKNGTYLCKVGEYWWLNPAYPEVRQLVADGVAEILAQYHVDGIHLDDYFYPTTETAFDAAAFADAKADDLGAFRLEQVNAMVQQIYSTVKAASPAIQLSISPQGTMDGNYTKQYADVRRWGTETGYCDVLIPQLYYGFANETAPFAETLQTWTETVSSESVSLVIGIGTHKCGKEDTWAGSGSMEWCSEPTLPIRQAKLALETNGTDGVAVYDYETTFQPDTAADALSQIREALGKLFRNGK